MQLDVASKSFLWAAVSWVDPQSIQMSWQPPFQHKQVPSNPVMLPATAADDGRLIPRPDAALYNGSVAEYTRPIRRRKRKPEDLHNDLCQACGEIGDLLCCDRCNLVYHLNCLEPPLLEVPEGDWFCPFCMEDQSQHEAAAIADAAEDAAAEQLRLGSKSTKITAGGAKQKQASAPTATGKRKRRTKAEMEVFRAAEAAAKGTLATAAPMDAETAATPVKENSRMKSPKRTKSPKCTGSPTSRANTPKSPKSPKRSKSPKVTAGGGGGKQKQGLEKENTRTKVTASGGKQKKRKCGECDACTAADCDTCKYCLDKPRNGGLNKMKKACIKRVCMELVIGGNKK